MHTYITDGNEIYRRSFAMIRAESDLTAFDADQAQVAVRMIHAAGQTDLAADIACSAGLVPAARAALRAGKPIFTDVNMVASGVTRNRLPADNEVICTLTTPASPLWQRSSAPPAPPPPWSCGRIAWWVPWWPLVTRRPRFSTCSIGWLRTRIAPDPPRFHLQVMIHVLWAVQ